MELPNHPFVNGELLWADRVQGGWRVANVPFFAYGISLGDVVVTADRGGHERVVVEVAVPSGERTLRMFFMEGVGFELQRRVAELLRSHGARTECAAPGWPGYWSVGVPADADYERVREELAELADADVLDFEMADEVVEGSFDVPEKEREEFEELRRQGGN